MVNSKTPMKKFLFFLFFSFLVISGNTTAQLANKNMYLLSNQNTHLTPYSAVWGYTAPDGREYAILGCFDGTSFVDITDADNIHQVGFVLSTSPGNGNNLWREMKTYSHYAYIVSEVANSGIQIVDLQYLPDSVHYVKKFLPAGYSSTHSISQSGPYLYVNGASIGQGVTVYDLTADPETPVKRGAYNNDYIHDCRIVNDTIYSANVYIGKVSIINAVNKNSLNLVTSFTNLPGAGPHNTALTSDRKYLLVTDEIGTAPYRLKIWNIEDLGNITFVSAWQPTGITTSIVHNVETYGNYALVAHYSSGIRLVDISNPAAPNEVAWYDTYPSDNNQSYEGCWGVYMFPSGKIAASDRSTGLYVVKTYFNINAAMEGFYNAGSNSMIMRDTVRAYLRESIAPYAVVDSSKSVIDSVSFGGSFKFNRAVSGTYYIVLKHRNCIETWSKASGFSYDPMKMMSYDFTVSDLQAYGNNMLLVDNSPVKYAMYSGDVNKDGSIELDDIIAIYTSAYNFTSGYAVCDLNGDNIVNLSDNLIAYNNSSSFVSSVTP
ncbi:MAG TPA: choice-of-anchor B family protein [Ignavibacteria bacterium]|nr:choice-of-anchor B family protein [Ignavibacteria bacterium]